MGERDADRRLTPQGERDAERLGAWMQARGLDPDWCVTSPAARARDTARIVLPDAAWTEDGRVYEAGVPDLLAVLADAPAGTGRLLLVGHNPGLEQLVRALDPGIPPPPDGELMATCTLVRLEVDAPRLGGGRVLDVVRLRDLD